MRDRGVCDLLYPADGDEGEAENRPRPYVRDLAAWRTTLDDPAAEGPRQLRAYLDRVAAVNTDVVAGAEPAGGAFPLCVLSVGGNMSRFFYTSLAAELASRGYRVAVTSHPGNGMDVDASRRLAVREAAEKRDPEVSAAITRAVAADVVEVLDGFDGPAVVIGHSRGGRAAGRLAREDRRVTAAVLIEAEGDPADRQRPLPVPLLAVHGDGPPERSRRLDAQVSLAAAGSRRVQVDGAGHFLGSDLPLIAPEVFPQRLDPREAHSRLAAALLNFLGQATSRPAPPPGPAELA